MASSEPPKSLEEGGKNQKSPSVRQGSLMMRGKGGREGSDKCNIVAKRRDKCKSFNYSSDVKAVRTSALLLYNFDRIPLLILARFIGSTASLPLSVGWRAASKKQEQRKTGHSNDDRHSARD